MNYYWGGGGLEDGPITIEELKREMRNMKNRKAPWWDMITNENLKHGGQLILATVTWVLNKIIRKEYLPYHRKGGLMVPIPKPNTQKVLKDNNRGITLVSVLYMLLERILLAREKVWLEDLNIMSELQGAGRTGILSLHTSMLVQQAVAENTSKGATVYAAFLDINKAFDSVWLPGFFYMLHVAELRQKPWKILRNAYHGFQCAVLIDGQPGK